MKLQPIFACLLLIFFAENLSAQVARAYFTPNKRNRTTDIFFDLEVPKTTFCDIKIEAVLDDGSGYFLKFTDPKLGKMPGGAGKKINWDSKLENKPTSATFFKIHCNCNGKQTTTEATDTPPPQPATDEKTDEPPSPIEPVTLFWVEPEAGSSQVLQSDRAHLKLGAKSKSALRFEDFRVKIDGKEYEFAKAEIGTIRHADQVFYFETDIRITAGSHEVTVECRGTTSEKVQFVYSAGRPSLYVLAVGVQHENLRFTVRDAEDFAKTYRVACQTAAMKKAFASYDIEELTGERATAANIGIAIERLKNRYRDGIIKSNDLVVIYISSHGMMYDGDYVVLGSDFLQTRSHKFSSYSMTQMHADLDKMLCTKVIFFDACHSGGGKGEDLPPVNFERLYIVGSSQAGEQSQESTAWQNGAFTEALLEAFDGRADGCGTGATVARDGVLTLAEVFNYARERVPKMVLETVQALQNPTLSQNPPPRIELIFLK